jgi:DNA-binding XRE family transcriptional regulator
MKDYASVQPLPKRWLAGEWGAVEAVIQDASQGHQTVQVRMAFCENLIYWRRKRKLTIESAARRLGVAPSTWCQWEKGRRNPSVQTLYMIAQTLEIPACYLFDHHQHCKIQKED